jgi:7-cyano-7-deazaguanine synthase
MVKAITLLSGGMDSTALLYHVRDKGYEVHTLSFDYGQRHSRELDAAKALAEELGVEHDIVSLGVHGKDFSSEFGSDTLWPLSKLLKGSSLTDESVSVPEGHYAEESMKQTVVPNRNAIMLSIAYGVAVAEGASLVCFAAHAGDHAIYPDCRPVFVGALSDALMLGNEWAEPLPEVKGPFLNYTKAQIVAIGESLDVPWEKTWTCYVGKDKHCGKCGTCVERKEAFRLARVVDPTEYVDAEYLIEAYVG